MGLFIITISDGVFTTTKQTVLNLGTRRSSSASSSINISNIGNTRN